ncbi:hypothetical protein Lepto7376_3926 [[Leptolyngbya] sp. PCC 7376]|uniref:hypothetical protein n=1 Tax=[Leptolyngbya] sp. PCC 7376 TaxID=111781 RepID=UPI00029EFB68|nr:hypothetical protein [[Leptolyngbya] sp. PCC 7376]AFY40075.1 hypothetical protein Lepto7376_3926 [[Leptolyngbya] sp. PCC 7376]
MEYPHWNFGVAIAFNLCLTGFNLYLLWKLPRWRRKLRDLRQKFTADERHIVVDLEQARQSMALLPEVQDKLISRKQQLRDYHHKLKLIIQLYRFLSR